MCSQAQPQPVGIAARHDELRRTVGQLGSEGLLEVSAALFERGQREALQMPASEEQLTAETNELGRAAMLERVGDQRSDSSDSSASSSSALREAAWMRKVPSIFR